jgi:hypothetical protein
LRCGPSAFGVEQGTQVFGIVVDGRGELIAGATLPPELDFDRDSGALTARDDG